MLLWAACFMFLASCFIACSNDDDVQADNENQALRQRQNHLTVGQMAKPQRWNHGVGSPDHFQEFDFSMLYYLSHSHFT